MVIFYIFEAIQGFVFFYRWLDNDPWIFLEKKSPSHSFPTGEGACETAGEWKQECDRLQTGLGDQDRWREEAPFGCINLLSS